MHTDYQSRIPVWLGFVLGHHPVHVFSSCRSATLTGSYQCLSVVTVSRYDLNVESTADHRKDAVRRDDPSDASHDGGGGGQADGGGVGAALQAAQTARERYDHPEERALENTQEERREVNGLDRAVQIDRRRDIEHQRRNQKAPGDANQVRKNTQ